MYRDEDRVTREETPRDEMLLDVCLEEVLSGQTPPDLRRRILAAMNQAGTPSKASDRAAALAQPPLVEPPLINSPPTEPPVQTAAQSATNGYFTSPIYVPSRVSSARSHRRADQRSWMSMTIAASLLLVGLGMGLLVWQRAQPQGAGHVAGGHDGVIASDTSEPDTSESRQQTLLAANRDPRDPNAHARQPAANPFRETLFGAGFPPVPEESAVPWPLPYAVERQNNDDVVRFVNEHLATRELPQKKIDDDTWCRRVFGQILGREPTSEELVDFATATSPRKREQLVDRLLADEAYREQYAQHWAGVWSDALLGPRVGDAQNSTARHDGLRGYLAAALRKGTPHDTLTEQLIAATGSSQRGDAQFNGATNFVLASADDKGESIDVAAMAETVSRVFLGHQGQCARCHNDWGHGNRRDGLSQQQFWQLAAFFQQTVPQGAVPQGAVPQGAGAEGATRLANRDFVGRSGDLAEAELYFDTPGKRRQIAYPVFIDGTPINPDGRVDVVDRRGELAELIVNSEEFSAATVDHYWQTLFGESMRDSSHGLARERLVQGLSEQFAAHDFDQRQLLRWIVLSEANARPIIDDAVPLYDNVAAALQDVGRRGRPVEAGDLVLFARVARTAGEANHSDRNAASIFVRDTGDASGGNGDASGGNDASPDFVQRISGSDMAFAAKVEHLFLHTIARRPNLREMSAARRVLSERDGQMADALDDIAWAIKRSAEYTARK